jgi:hypothetical protein
VAACIGIIQHFTEETDKYYENLKIISLCAVI